MTIVADTITLTGRSLRHQVRQVDGLIMSIVLPVMLLTMFVYVFGGALGGDGGRTFYIDYVVPGIIVLVAGFSASQVAIAVTEDLTTGTIDRFRAMSTSVGSLLAGHVAANVLRNVASTLLVLVVAIVMGFRPTADGRAWLGVITVTLLFMVAIAAVSVAIGVAARSPEGASGFTFFVLFLPYLSSAFVPTDTLPTALRGVAEHQPITPVIETMRAWLLGGQPGSDAWLAVGWCLAITLAAIPVAGWAFRRRVAV